MNLRNSSLVTEEPFHIPGYAGHKPQYEFQCGNTFGKTTHDLLVSLNTSQKPILQPIKTYRPKSAPGSPDVKNVLENRRVGHPICQVYKPQMRSGYMGHVPGANFSAYNGKGFPSICDQSLIDFTNRQLTNRKAFDDAINNRNRPLVPLKKPRDNRTPYDLHSECVKVRPTLNKNLKYFMSGYAGHVPFYQNQCGKTYNTMTNYALKTFENQQHKHKKVTLQPISPASIATLKTPVDFTHQQNVKCGGVYSTELGIIPKYAGHVPEIPKKNRI